MAPLPWHPAVIVAHHPFLPPHHPGLPEVRSFLIRNKTRGSGGGGPNCHGQGLSRRAQLQPLQWERRLGRGKGLPLARLFPHRQERPAAETMCSYLNRLHRPRCAGQIPGFHAQVHAELEQGEHRHVRLAPAARGRLRRGRGHLPAPPRTLRGEHTKAGRPQRPGQVSAAAADEARAARPSLTPGWVPPLTSSLWAGRREGSAGPGAHLGYISCPRSGRSSARTSLDVRTLKQIT